MNQKITFSFLKSKFFFFGLNFICRKLVKQIIIYPSEEILTATKNLLVKETKGQKKSSSSTTKCNPSVHREMLLGCICIEACVRV